MSPAASVLPPANQSGSAAGAASTVAAGLPESRVLIIGTGGTICMQQGPDGLRPSGNFLETAMAPLPTFNDQSSQTVTMQASLRGKLMSIASLRTPPTVYNRHIRYGIVEFDPLLDSSSISAHDWDAMAECVRDNYNLFDGFVILHGTDSLSYTASALSFIMANLGKPVILTGSQAPIFALQSDAVGNLLGSLVIAGTFVIPEVCLFFHDRLYRGNRTTKVSAASFQAFDSPNLAPLAEVNGLGISVNWSLAERATDIAPFAISRRLDTAHVACLRVFPGIKPEMVDAVLRLPDIRGLILETFGMGNVPGGDDGSSSGDGSGCLIRVVKAAVDRGVVVVNVSQCVSGFVSPVYAPGTQLGRAGVIFGLDLTAEAALAKLSYLLTLGLSSSEIAEQFPRSLRGELTEVAHPTFRHPPPPLQDPAARLTAIESAFTALGYAIQNHQMVVVRELLAGDGRRLLKTADYAGNTAVHLAAVSGDAAIMLELLQQGASVHERNRANNSPLLLATLCGNDECVQLLKAAGAHLSIEEIERRQLTS